MRLIVQEIFSDRTVLPHRYFSSARAGNTACKRGIAASHRGADIGLKSHTHRMDNVDKMFIGSPKHSRPAAKLKAFMNRSVLINRLVRD